MREFDNKIPDYLTAGLFLSQEDDESIKTKSVRNTNTISEPKTADTDAIWKRVTVRSVPLIIRVK